MQFIRGRLRVDEPERDSNPNLVSTIGGYHELVKRQGEHVHACNVTLQILYDIYCLML